MKRHLFIAIFLFALLCFNCSDDVIRNVTVEHPPMWPQHGYNARQTGNVNSPAATMNPVMLGVTDWSYSFPAVGYTDGSEFCVDSKGNIYFVSEEMAESSLYKFSPDGYVIWKIDSIVATNFSAISINKNEDRIYFVARRNDSELKLHCVDSSGHFIWTLDSAYFTQKIVIRKDNNLYCFIGNKLSCVSPDGNIIWATQKFNFMEGSRPALDNSDNIYFSTFTGIAKADKNGNLVWSKNYAGRASGMVIDGFGNIYFVAYDDNKLYSINSSGELRWTFNSSYSFCVPVIGKNNTIYAMYGDTNAYIAGLDISGKILWKTRPFLIYGGTLTPEGMLLDDNENIYYITEHYNIIAESLDKNGNLRWTSDYLNLGGTLSFPVLIPQGKLLICPKRGFKIQALK
jgi:sugar lactone lactonase YvrE